MATLLPADALFDVDGSLEPGTIIRDGERFRVHCVGCACSMIADAPARFAPLNTVPPSVYDRQTDTVHDLQTMEEWVKRCAARQSERDRQDAVLARLESELRRRPGFTKEDALAIARRVCAEYGVDCAGIELVELPIDDVPPDGAVVVEAEMRPGPRRPPRGSA